MGIPSTSDISVLATEYPDGVTGVLFTYKDSEQLAVRMDQLYYKKEL